MAPAPGAVGIPARPLVARLLYYSHGGTGSDGAGGPRRATGGGSVRQDGKTKFLSVIGVREEYSMSNWKERLGWPRTWREFWGLPPRGHKMLSCPHCKGRIYVPPEEAGTTVTCPHTRCAKPILIPNHYFDRQPPVKYPSTIESKTAVNSAVSQSPAQMDARKPAPPPPQSAGSGTPEAIERCPSCRGKLTFIGIQQGDLAIFTCPSCNARMGNKVAVGLKRSSGDWR